ARIGGEVYELQRPEIDELAEPTTATAVGSITMPHKRNPESSEHLDTLARLARSSAAVLTEGMTQLHERDGRGWKAEWVALPEVCLLTGAALRTARTIVSGLEVHAGVMAANLVRHGDAVASERVLAGLSTRLGKHQAQAALQEVLTGRPADLAAALAECGLASVEDVRGWIGRPPVATAGEMVDAVLARAATARAGEPETWP
ncbi:MAG: class-II fumarase/aspartase family protein, partial [Pseudonocardiaceae bacterium]